VKQNVVRMFESEVHFELTLAASFAFAFAFGRRKWDFSSIVNEKDREKWHREPGENSWQCQDEGKSTIAKEDKIRQD
jgi:hypothetical protein